MRKILLIFALAVATFSGFSQEPVAVDTAAAVEQADVPDSLCVTIKDERICFPTKDAQETKVLIEQFIKENDGNWPTSWMGWAVLIIGTIAGGRYTAVWSNATKIYFFLKGFLKDTLNVVAFVSGLFATGVTFLVGVFTGELFAWNIFGVVWPTAAFASVWIYEKRIKKNDSVPAAR